MSRTSYTFSVLQATAAIASLAIIMWSLGLPVLRFAEAASVTTFSNTLSDSAPSQVSNHTIEFTTPTGVSNGETITLDFSDGPFVVGAVDHTDIDVATSSGEFSLAADCTGSEMASAAFSGTTLTITMCTGDPGNIAANGTTTIEIGTNATHQTTGDQQLVNPAAGSYQIVMDGTQTDSGETRVAIVDNVTVSATVDTIFNFTVNSIGTGVSVGGENTTGPTTATTIPFGELEDGTASTAAQELLVTTNAANGFTVTVETNQQLSSASADIDGFIDGSYTTTPTGWQSPTGTIGVENEAGHWGLSSTDTTLSGGDTYTGGVNFVSASTTPVEVMYNDGPADQSFAGIGQAEVKYKVEITGLQEAGTYTATLTYVATPVF